MEKNGTDISSPQKLKTITLDYTGDQCELNMYGYPTLDSKTENTLVEMMKVQFKNNKAHYRTLLSSFIKDALLKPKIKQEFVNTDGAIQNSFTKHEWGDTSLIKLSDFLFELDAYREDGVPYYTKYIDRLRAYAKEHSFSGLEELITFLGSKKDYKIPLDALNLFAKQASVDFGYGMDSIPNMLLSEEDSKVSKALLDFWWTEYGEENISNLLQ